MMLVHAQAKRFARNAFSVIKGARTTNAVAICDDLHSAGVGVGALRSFAAGPSFDYEPDYSKKHDIVRKSGVDVLHDALYNKVPRLC